MSGIEVVGLILGAFPLAISALEHYRESCKVLNCLANFEREYRKLLNDIKDEYLIYTLNLKVLLLPLVDGDGLDEDDIQLLLEDPSHERWRSNDMNLALRGRLGIAHTRFLEIGKDLQGLIWELLTVLGIDKPRLQARLRVAAKSPRQGSLHPTADLKSNALAEILKTSFEYRKEQLKFGFGRSQRDELLKEIRTTNEKLDRLLVKSEKVATYQQSLTTSVAPRAVKSLLQYWRDADRIYALLHRSWGCLCQEKHCAHLWLQHRTGATFEFKLLVLWSPQSVSAQPCPPWISQGLLITRTESRVERLRVPLSSVSGSALAPPTAGAARYCARGSAVGRSHTMKKAVKFQPPDVMAVAVAPCDTVPQPKRVKLTAPPHADAGLLHEISQLCSAMVACGMSPAFLGALTDAEKGSQYSVHSQPEQKMTAQEITLKEALGRRLKRSDRFRIALAVASSHLQLHSTSWARKQWAAEDILFPSTGPSASDIVIDKPYVSANFVDRQPSMSRAHKTTDRSFASLGVMLMELLFGVGLEAHELWLSPGFADNKSKPLFRQMVAREWADSVDGEAGPDMSAAVMWCLNESPTTLEGDQWRRDLAHKVVLPLQNCCDWIQGKSLG
ncbi:hypothetical protein LTR53_005652 [Teratosphaeriaceae sp. CCFEE 6253]|nr:hypothetical protein LTR53_005652 [Teratosphaeriaceae sp. CCFEE 6253]